MNLLIADDESIIRKGLSSIPWNEYSFVQFLTAVRIYHAALMLRSSNLRISEISANVGIPNEQYFSQLFKTNYGVSPNVYRKRQKPEKPSPIIQLLEKLPADL